MQGASVYIYALAPCTEKKYDEICYLEYCSYICEQYSRYGRKERLYCYAGTVGKICQSIAIMHFLAKQKTCYFGDIHEELPIAKATVSQHLKELKDAGLIQGEVETPKVKYCINRENWQLARELFKEFFGQCICKSGECC